MDVRSSNLNWRGSLTPLNKRNIKGIALHHMAHETASIEEVHRWHLNRGWTGLGYNFWIDKEGHVYEGRGWHQGAHVRGHNQTTIGVGFQGDFQQNDSMTGAQVRAGANLIEHLFSQLGRKVECQH
ncbi:N-acetylmuramoyl-L-alanine amidase [Texcoconibacillus texcoconensis]|uniref:Autolysin n=1 Tax=Texcoconibacillus texcoconensis TaxID=1095777 RepID=A0A840QUV3_9BACI|nr:N-acetylmuramoyl-L-alanine amidase [Texcoconibacillus texcoconensis]MBB5175120.1 hypothetical protein [Texcoconibacillus texcoconensis]